MEAKRVLIIDDESFMRNALAESLEEHGYQTETAGNGWQGLQKAQAEDFHAVLVDLRMPELDGLEVIATLRVQKPDLPVVVISGTGVLGDVIEALRRGAWDYVTKPIHDMAETVVVLERVLERARLLAGRTRAEQALQEAYDELEERVRERTTELTEANLALQAEVATRQRVEEELQRKSLQQAHLIEAARYLAGSLDQKQVLTRVGVSARQMLNAYGCELYLLQDDGQTLAPVVAVHPTYEEELLAAPLEVENSLTGLAVKRRQGLIFNQPGTHPSGYLVPGTPEEPSERLIAAPLIADGRVLGAMTLTRMGVPFKEEDLTLAETFAAYAAAAVKNAQMYQELQHEVDERARADKEIRRRAAHQEALNTVIAAAAAAADLVELLETALDQTLNALGLHIGRIWMPPHSVIRGLPPEVDGSMAQAAQLLGFDTPDSNVMSDWQGLSRDHPLSAIGPLMLRCGIRSSLTVSLQGESGSIGGLSVADAAPRTWSADEIALTEAIGQQVGTAAERLRLITQIQEQALQVQGIINSVPEGVILLNSDMRILLVNPPASEYLMNLANARLGDTLSHLGSHPLSGLLTKPREGLWHEVEVYEPGRRTFEVVVRPIEAGPAAGRWVMVMRDVTEAREAQRRVQRQEQLAVVGQLAAGIAHDFNNIMAVITLYSQVAQRTPDLPLETQERLRTVDQQARRAADLIQQILDFSRRSVLERHPLDMVSMLKEQVKLLERTLPESIQIELTHGPGEYTIHADPTRIQQVIINLALNARDAMPDGGQLRLSLGRVHITHPSRLPLPEMEMGSWLKMTVSDTGTGISADALPHIFEPFFTTKEVGKGTGLGLAQVYGIVKQHGGHISLESQTGSGTTFTIYLPALPVPKLQPEESSSRELPLGQGETVLVVEDNHVTRQALVASLEMLNYQPIEAGNGREALAVHKEHQGDIALVICDLVMPRMGGLDLALALMEDGSKAKVVIISGHPIQDEIDSLREKGVHTWLQKPIDLDQLAQVVAHTLQE